MFEDRTYKRTFYSAPQSVTSLVAAFLEPSITVLTFLFATVYAGETVDRPALTLCLLVFALTFPGRNRFRDNLIAAGVDILSSWVMLVAILALCGYATRSLHFFDNTVLLDWLIATPVLQWLAVWIGRVVVQRVSALPSARRAAIVVGAGALGVKVAKALTESTDHGVDFVGYFDDRTDDRVHADASPQRLGGLKDVASFITEHGVREVYITLPLGSQPRIISQRLER